MSWLSFMPAIIKGVKWVTKGVIDHFNQKRAFKAREAAAEHGLKLAIAQAKITRVQQEGAWETAAVKNAGWRADALFVIVMAPLVLCFIPGMVQYVQGGFMALGAAIPEWWLWLVGGAAGTSLGIKPMTQLNNWRKTR